MNTQTTKQRVIRRRLVGVAVAFAVLAAAPARAADVGVRGGIYSFEHGPDRPFLGAELLLHAGGGFYVNPNAEFVFVDGRRFFTLNLDAHYDLPVRGPYLWIGGGLAVEVADPDGPAASSTEAHANVLAGIGFRTGAVVPYVQLKLVTGAPTIVVAAAGIRF
ncbi:MAG: hypothetical protein QM704_07425 [Anaeromyxobacteraceae bacterium]